VNQTMNTCDYLQIIC